MVDKTINIIVAMTKNRVIGAGNALPWKISEEIKLFKKLTENNAVIMGKNTWLSLPQKFRPLPNRLNIIVSKTLGKQEGAVVCKTIEKALEVSHEMKKEIYCIGGAKLFYSMLPISQNLHISWIKKNYTGDTYFPNIDFSKWEEKHRKEFSEFTYVQYLRKIEKY